MAEDTLAAEIEAARAKDDAEAARSGQGYNPPKRRGGRVSKKLAGGRATGNTRLDKVRENATKPIPGVDSVRDRLPSTDRFYRDADEMREMGANPDTERVYFCNTEEADRQLKNSSRRREMLQRGRGAVRESKDVPASYEGGMKALIIPRELDVRREKRMEARRDELDSELQIAAARAKSTTDDEKQAIVEQARRISMAGENSPTRGLSLQEAFRRIPADQREAIHQRALMRVPATQEGPRDPEKAKAKRTFFDMGRRG